MLSHFIKNLVLSLVIASSFLPAIAQDGSDDGTANNPAPLKDPIKAPELKKRTDEDMPQAKSSHSDVALPVRMASFTTGVLFGTPVSVVRALGRQTKAGSKDLIGESHNPVLLATTYLFSFPFAFAGCPFEGAYMSIINSWNGSAEEPFSKETFSMQPGED